MDERSASMNHDTMGSHLIAPGLRELLDASPDLLWQDTLSKYPSSVTALLNRGVIYGMRNELTKALEDFNRAISIDPGSANAYNNRGVAYYKAKEYDKALADVRKAEELGYSVDHQLIDALKKAMSSNN
jgi:tetratricopeptide (TPR) repeat protein